MPATTPTGFGALVLDYGVEHLAQSATFRTIVGAASAALARGFIVKRRGGNPQQAGGEGRTTMADGSVKARPANYGLVTPEEPVVRRVSTAFREWMHTGRLYVIVVRSFLTTDSAELIEVRSQNEVDAIESEIRAQCGQADRFIAMDTEVHGPTEASPVGPKRLTVEYQIIIDWRDVA